jgi:small nuclear ribonucleoprotein (snRNP)-like protein
LFDQNFRVTQRINGEDKYSRAEEVQLPFNYRYLDKRLSLELNGNRKVTGVLRGFDPFMNIVLEDTIEIVEGKEGKQIGSVVCCLAF